MAQRPIISAYWHTASRKSFQLKPGRHRIRFQGRHGCPSLPACPECPFVQQFQWRAFLHSPQEKPDGSQGEAYFKRQAGYGHTDRNGYIRDKPFWHSLHPCKCPCRCFLRSEKPCHAADRHSHCRQDKIGQDNGVPRPSTWDAQHAHGRIVPFSPTNVKVGCKEQRQGCP